MEDNKNFLIENWLYKSEKALQQANISLDNDMLEVVCNRAYYAVFYAVTALSQYNDAVKSKHTELKGWFNYNYIKTGIFDVSFGKLYGKLHDIRSESDYTVTYTPDKESLTIYLKDIDKFINRIKNYIAELEEKKNN